MEEARGERRGCEEGGGGGGGSRRERVCGCEGDAVLLGGAGEDGEEEEGGV